MNPRIIGETPNGLRATASATIDSNAPCRIDYVRDGEEGTVAFVNFAMAQTAAIRALHSDLGFSRIHVSQAHKAFEPQDYFEGHGHWFKTLRPNATA